MSLAAASTIEPAACPSAHCCCGGVWARRVDGPALDPWGHTTPCHLASHARRGFRWAPCRKLNWERDALAGCLRNRWWCGSAWWWLILIALAILRSPGVESFFNSLISSTTNPPLVLSSLSYLRSKTLVHCPCRSSHNLAKSIIHFFHITASTTHSK